jgi:hypothetical protein
VLRVSGGFLAECLPFSRVAEWQGPPLLTEKMQVLIPGFAGNQRPTSGSIPLFVSERAAQA